VTAVTYSHGPRQSLLRDGLAHSDIRLMAAAKDGSFRRGWKGPPRGRGCPVVGEARDGPSSPTTGQPPPPSCKCVGHISQWETT